MRSIHLAIGLLAYMTLSGAGCVPEPTTGLVKPSSRCMKTGAIPRPKVGEDATAYSGRLINHAKGEASKQRCLQRWVKTVSN